LRNPFPPRKPSPSYAKTGQNIFSLEDFNSRKRAKELAESLPSRMSLEYTLDNLEKQSKKALEQNNLPISFPPEFPLPQLPRHLQQQNQQNRAQVPFIQAPLGDRPLEGQGSNQNLGGPFPPSRNGPYPPSTLPPNFDKKRRPIPSIPQFNKEEDDPFMKVTMEEDYNPTMKRPAEKPVVRPPPITKQMKTDNNPLGKIWVKWESG
jgi:hypothetical protein